MENAPDQRKRHEEHREAANQCLELARRPEFSTGEAVAVLTAGQVHAALAQAAAAMAAAMAVADGLATAASGLKALLDGFTAARATGWEQHLKEALGQAQPTGAVVERCPRVSRPATGMGDRCILLAGHNERDGHQDANGQLFTSAQAWPVRP